MDPHENFKAKFIKKIPVKALILPIHLIKLITSTYKEFLLNIPKHPSILKELLPNNCKKLILKTDLSKTPFESWPENFKSFLTSNKISIQDHELTFTYENYSLNEILQEVLPKDVTIPSGFENIGTIAHLNLLKNQLPYKNIIAQVLLDKNTAIKTVVNKTDALSNTFRTPELEILAGVPNLETEVKEGKCLFQVEYDKVYWNSKLQAERERMLDLFKENDVILDLFCGVGPLSVRAAKKNCFVIANDLNPHCYKYLKLNVSKNNVTSKVVCFNMDARECFRKVVDGQPNEINTKIPSNLKYFNHVYMNLPGDAITFLDMFYGFFKNSDKNWENKELPLIHVYSFSESDEEKSKDILTKRIKEILPNFDNKDMTCFHSIRDVSVHKKMFGITFRLSKADALGIVPKEKEKKVEEFAKDKEENKSEDYGDLIKKKIKTD